MAVPVRRDRTRHVTDREPAPLKLPPRVTRGQRLALTVVTIAAFLLIGRGAAIVFVNYAWYEALGALSVWKGQVRHILVFYGGGLVLAATFVYVNLLAVRRSILKLVVPKRIANIEIGEEVPSSKLFILMAGISGFAAIISILSFPPWTMFAMWRNNVKFGATEPYFGLDLGYYVTRFPLEYAIYEWCFVIFAITALTVIFLYALTPSLRWGQEGLHVTTYARRHIIVLASILVLLIAWSVRLDAFRVLIAGSGLDSAFSYPDHRWIIPANLVVSVITVAGAIALLATGWFGQLQGALLTVSLIIASVLGVKGILPIAAERSARNPANAAREAPYRATQKLYVARAFPNEPTPPSVLDQADTATIAAAPKVRFRGGYKDMSYPGARTIQVLPDTANRIVAARAGNWFSRVMHAWAEQRPDILHVPNPHETAVVRIRDVRQRIRAIAPIFAQSRAIGVRSTGTSVVWIVDLYVTSETYPLSEQRSVGPTTISYRHHVATAYVHGASGAVRIVPDQDREPISMAWFAHFPGTYLSSTTDPTFPFAFQTPEPRNRSVPDSVFRNTVYQIYERMRTALDSADFQKFGREFDSLGRTLGVE